MARGPGALVPRSRRPTRRRLAFIRQTLRPFRGKVNALGPDASVEVEVLLQRLQKQGRSATSSWRRGSTGQVSTRQPTTTGAAETGCGRWQQAADEYLRLIDDDWLKVADWYRSGAPEP